MKLRVLTALPLALTVAWLIWQSSQWLFLLALVVTVEHGLYEFFNISRQAGFKVFPKVGYVAGGALCLAQMAELRRPGSFVLAVLLLTFLLTFWLALHLTEDLKQYLGAAATTVFGVLYVAFTLCWLVPLRFSEPLTGRNLVFLLFIVIWAGDIFAYLGGRIFGRTPLFVRVSPKKTVEGAVAGFTGSMAVAWVFTRWVWRAADLETTMVLAGLIAAAGQLGDLAESALKRGADLKDSGTLLPGHGGLLDRIDSLLFGTPILWLAVTFKELFK